MVEAAGPRTKRSPRRMGTGALSGNKNDCCITMPLTGAVVRNERETRQRGWVFFSCHIQKRRHKAGVGEKLDLSRTCLGNAAGDEQVCLVGRDESASHFCLPYEIFSVDTF